jgi:hypothetical protein
VNGYAASSTKQLIFLSNPPLKAKGKRMFILHGVSRYQRVPRRVEICESTMGRIWIKIIQPFGTNSTRIQILKSELWRVIAHACSFERSLHRIAGDYPYDRVLEVTRESIGATQLLFDIRPKDAKKSWNSCPTHRGLDCLVCISELLTGLDSLGEEHQTIGA